MPKKTLKILPKFIVGSEIVLSLSVKSERGQEKPLNILVKHSRMNLI